MTESYISDWPGKSAQVPDGPCHPAAYHMLDVAAVAEVLIEPFGFPEPLRDALILLTALHDLGKIGAGFRAMLQTGTRQIWRHWEMTEVYLFQHDDDLMAGILGGRGTVRKQLYSAAAGHHGRPPTLSKLDDHRLLEQSGPEAARDAPALIKAFAALWPAASLDGISTARAKELGWWLAGFVSAADWIGSNTEWFAPVAAGPDLGDYLDAAREAAPTAVRLAGLDAPHPSDKPLFDFTLRPMQAACAGIGIPAGQTLAIIEDETGSGKTEAALILAQRMMLAGKGRGIYFALPTTATADAMFSRARKLVSAMFDGPPSLTLAHGRAELSDEYRALRAPRNSPTDEPVCTDWLADNRRRALLGNVGVGTIDQALLSVLPTRFNTLRHFGLSSKILIVDEVHEMGTPYMATTLAQLLRAHRAAGGSAILLTATLPLDQRAALLDAWGAGDDGDASYPALTMAGGAARRDFAQTTGAKGPVTAQRVASVDEAVTLLADAAARGAGCVWVRNAVDDAIAGVQALRDAGVAADLLHARFTLSDRLTHEGTALSRFGRDGQGRAGRVLVATQVVESSLDLDFDVMLSDLAPMAALIQRAGRLWRHMDLRPRDRRPVPAPVLHVLSPDPAEVEDDRWLHRVLDRGGWVYPLDLQWRTAQVLFDRGQIDAPSGLRDLIETAHGSTLPVPPVLEQAELEREGLGYAEANQAWRNLIRFGEGYRQGGGAEPDTNYPTRLGLPTKTLMLAVWQDGALRPYAAAEAWQLSEVSVAEHRLHGLDLPDQSAPEIAALTADWPEWRRAAVTVCPLGENGQICAGLRYDRGFGILFDGESG
ncbi:MAG: CRISPR-associated helicase Cas3' [Paracoccus sp. (in: a-proteobacteria)]|nr:CRISPR-associated helicase Cas3' [Paracoccus sp. (in: a-proteobacteria)]